MDISHVSIAIASHRYEIHGNPERVSIIENRPGERGSRGIEIPYGNIPDLIRALQILETLYGSGKEQADG